MKEFIYRRQVRLQDTDATGALYFAEQFKMALEAFEEYLTHSQLPLQHLIESPYLFPVVHAEADYSAPVRVGDELDIHLSIAAVGTKSATFSYRFIEAKRQVLIGTVKIIHAAVERTTGHAIPLPDLFRDFLELKNNLLDEKIQNLVTIQ